MPCTGAVAGRSGQPFQLFPSQQLDSKWKKKSMESWKCCDCRSLRDLRGLKDQTPGPGLSEVHSLFHGLKKSITKSQVFCGGTVSFFKFCQSFIIKTTNKGLLHHPTEKAIATIQLPGGWGVKVLCSQVQ